MTDPKPCPTCGAPLPADATGGACPKCLLQAGFATGSGSAIAAGGREPTPEELAPLFPGLVIESLVGRGGMGVVYKARHKALDREVALKILPAGVASDRAFADRFQREARALAKLQHPNIVAVHDFGETDGLFWLVMEYVDGANIRQAMRAGQIHPKEALAIVPQICDALQYAHDHGVVHRDIKPENVLLDKAGRVKVADFGLAKLMEQSPADHTLTGAGQVMGTPHYMAPEQWEKPTSVDHRADIYSLGVVFYEMLTGELPVGRFAAPSKKSDVDARIDEIVLRTLEREREARYQQVAEVKTDMGRAATSPPTAVAAPSPEPRRGGAAWLAAAGVVGCAVAVLIITSSKSPDIVRTVASVGGIVTGALLIGHVWSRRRHGRSDAQRPRWGWWIVVASLLVCGGPIAVFSFLVVTGTRVQIPVKSKDPVARMIAAGEEVSDLCRRLQGARSSDGIAWAEEFYDADSWRRIEALETDARLAKSAAGEIGLPLADDSFLHGSLGDYGGANVRFGKPTEVSLTSQHGKVWCFVVRTDDGWRFMDAPVVYEAK